MNDPSPRLAQRIHALFLEVLADPKDGDPQQGAEWARHLLPLLEQVDELERQALRERDP